MFGRRRILITAGLLVVGVALLFVPLLVIRVDTDGRLTSDPADVSHHQVALVLGAGLTRNGTPTWFLADRLDAAIRLYRTGKVDGLLMSGDNHTTSHDEPTAMRTYAIAHGVPAAAITLDYAGFDTYDSCYRARHIFGVQSAVVVTQSYHAPRAVYLCRSVGVDADALTVPDWGRVPAAKMAHYQAREVLADVKAVWDADVTNPSPRYLGAHEQLHLQPATVGAG
ncbi:MAG TPA: ElyC/SanA/YdcF family protein [Gaiellales bacterium]|jgi:vancomycin permeability regulator SanA|nr:ElyC/SanA/YdcF family protein [Gaiellales bacterium]